MNSLKQLQTVVNIINESNKSRATLDQMEKQQLEERIKKSQEDNFLAEDAKDVFEVKLWTPIY